MKVLLVNPPYRRLRGVGAIYFPIGLGYLAAVLERGGYEVKIYNGEVPRDRNENEISKYKGGDVSYIMSTHQRYIKNLEDDDFFVWRQFRQSLNDFKPDMVGILVRTPMLSSALKINRLVREWSKNCYIVWGGSHSTNMPDKVMAYKEVDFLVYGEGEISLLCLVKALENKDDLLTVKGIYYKSLDGRIIKNPPRDYIKKLDDLPMPARHLVFKEDLYPQNSFADLMGSRGCPFFCTCCSAHTLWGRKVRYRSVPNIIKEIKILKNKYQCNYLRFTDDNLTLNRQWLEELCRALVTEEIDIKWTCLTRIDLIDEDLLKLMIKAGCDRIDIGIESGSPRILKLMKKNISLEDVLRGDRLFNKYNFSWGAFFITGFPYETREDFIATVKFMKKINPYRIVLSNFTPFPGTEDYERTKQLGTLPQKIDWGLYEPHSPHNFFVANINQEDYRVFFKKLSDYVSLRNTHRIRGRERYYFRHPFSFLRKVIGLIKRRTPSFL